MPGRKVVPMAMNKKHFTKDEAEERQRAEAALKGNADQVRPPAWLNDVAKKEFRRLAKELIALEIISNVDVGGLAIACDSYSKYIMATKAITENTINAEVTKKTDDTTVKKVPLSAVEKFAGIYRQYCAEYGLTPAARIKLSASLRTKDESDEASGVAQFLQRRA